MMVVLSLWVLHRKICLSYLMRTTTPWFTIRRPIKPLMWVGMDCRLSRGRQITHLLVRVVCLSTRPKWLSVTYPTGVSISPRVTLAWAIKPLRWFPPQMGQTTIIGTLLRKYAAVSRLCTMWEQDKHWNVEIPVRRLIHSMEPLAISLLTTLCVLFLRRKMVFITFSLPMADTSLLIYQQAVFPTTISSIISVVRRIISDGILLPTVLRTKG